MSPIAFHSLGNLISRYGNRLPYRQARDTREHIVLISLHARYGDAGNSAFARDAGIGDVRVYDFLLGSEAAK